KTHRCCYLQGETRLIERNGGRAVQRVDVLDVENVVGPEVEPEVLGRLVAGESVHQRVVVRERIALWRAVVLDATADGELVVEEAEADLAGDLRRRDRG